MNEQQEQQIFEHIGATKNAQENTNKLLETITKNQQTMLEFNASTKTRLESGNTKFEKIDEKITSVEDDIEDHGNRIVSVESRKPVSQKLVVILITAGFIALGFLVTLALS